MNQKTRKAEIALLIATLIWGGTFPFIKLLLDDMGPHMMVALRFLIAALVFPLIFRKVFAGYSRRALFQGLLISVMMYGGYALQTIGMEYTTASRSSFITYTFALIVPFLQFFILKLKPTLSNIIGLVIVSAGVFSLSGPMTGGTVNSGDLITLLSALSYAFYIVFLNKYTNEKNQLFLIFIQLLSCGVFGIILAFTLETPRLTLTPTSIIGLLYLGLIASTLTTYLMNRFQREMRPSRAAILYGMEPLFAVFLSYLILSESLSKREILGCLLILGGVLFSELVDFSRPKTETKAA